MRAPEGVSERGGRNVTWPWVGVMEGGVSALPVEAAAVCARIVAQVAPNLEPVLALKVANDGVVLPLHIRVRHCARREAHLLCAPIELQLELGKLASLTW